jgi:hypothetical protein
MTLQIEEFRKQIYKSHGYIDDQAVSLEEHIKELLMQKTNIQQSLEMDKKNTNLKLRLKYVMQRKVQKTMEFFCSNQNLFIKYYDSLIKIGNSKIHILNKSLDEVNQELSSIFDKGKLEVIRKKYSEKLIDLKNKMQKINTKEENLSSELHNYKHLEINVDELFKEEIDYYKISEDF